MRAGGCEGSRRTPVVDRGPAQSAIGDTEKPRDRGRASAAVGPDDADRDRLAGLTEILAGDRSRYPVACLPLTRVHRKRPRRR